MENKNYLKATDVAEFIGVSVPTAYKIVQRLNTELKNNGYITISGRVPKKYFLEKVYGGERAYY